MDALHIQAAILICYLLSVINTSSAQDQEEWKFATATYSNDTDDSIVTEGACGACFEVRCVDQVQWCLQGSPSIVLTATDFCPPNYGFPADDSGWCNFPRAHFQIPEASFSLIAHLKAEMIPIQYRRVMCDRKGGIRFTIKGSAYFMQVLINNIGLDGEVITLKVKGSRTGWIPMGRNWGQNWQCNINLAGQPLSFEVTTASRRTLASYGVAPQNWKFGQTFQGKQF